MVGRQRRLRRHRERERVSVGHAARRARGRRRLSARRQCASRARRSIEPRRDQARRTAPDRDPASYGAGGAEATTFVQNTARRLAPDQAGDLTAIAAMLPGVALASGGISVARPAAEPEQRHHERPGIRGKRRAARRGDAASRASVHVRPSNGWFSGAQTAVDLVVGGQFTQRSAHLTLDAPSLQYTDRVSAQSGQRYTNMNASVGGSGQLLRDGWAYNYGLQGGRKSADVASLLDGGRQPARARGARAGFGRGGHSSDRSSGAFRRAAPELPAARSTGTSHSSGASITRRTTGRSGRTFRRRTGCKRTPSFRASARRD